MSSPNTGQNLVNIEQPKEEKTKRAKETEAARRAKETDGKGHLEAENVAAQSKLLHGVGSLLRVDEWCPGME